MEMVEVESNEPGSSSSSTRSSSFDVTRAFTFFFEDRNWVPKLAIGALCAFLSPFLIGLVFMMGYSVSLARRVRGGEMPGLPEWDDLQGIFFDGLRGLIVTVAHKLPLVFLGILLLFALMGGIFLGRSEDSLEEFMFLGLPALFGGFVVVFLLALVVIVYVPAAFVRFIQTDSVASAFDFIENVEFIRENLSPYLTGVLVIVLAGIVAQFGFFFFCIGVFPATFWSTCVMGYVVGELSKLRVGPPPEGQTQ
jgi:hypothetical protein